jgi:DNA repair protein RadC
VSPGKQKIASAKDICEATQLMGIKVLDHIVIGGDQYLSFAEEGLM